MSSTSSLGEKNPGSDRKGSGGHTVGDHANVQDSLLALPQALESEKIILGTLILEPTRIVDAVEILGEGDAFFSKIHGEVYRALVTLGDDPTKVIEPSVLLQELETRRGLGGMDLPGLLADLEMAVIAPESIHVHLERVQEKSRLRRLIAVCRRTIEVAQAEEIPVSELLDRTERDIFSIANEQDSQAMIPIDQLTNMTLEQIEARMHDRRAVSGVPTNFYDLDAKTGGFQPSDLIILGARPSMGKTALALNIGLNVAQKANQPVGIFSMEMSSIQLNQRLLSLLSKVGLQRLRTGKLDHEAYDEITDHGMVLGELPILIDDTFGVSILELRSKARRMASQAGGKLGLLIIDYLQLMSAQKGARTENRQQEISEISRSLKALARELDCPVLALSQLSRQSEQRKSKDKRPILSDLRESGAIEQDADVVMFVHREEYYNRRELAEKQEKMGFNQKTPAQVPTPSVELAELIIAKQRNGPVGTVELIFQPDLARFANKDFTRKPPPAEQ
jgi:replicative DNA helicase